MMDTNRATPGMVAMNGTGVESDKEANTSANGSDVLDRRFGSVDIWMMRRNARKFRIHGRIPRL